MRERTHGFEGRDSVTEGITIASGTIAFVTTNPTAHKDFAGNGGSYCVQGNNSSSATVWNTVLDFASGRSLRHYRGRYLVYVSAVSGSRINLLNGTTAVISIRVTSTGSITINNQAGTVLATAASLLQVNNWSNVEFEVYHASSGFVRIYVNGDYTTAWLSYSGETRGTGGTLTTINRVGGYFDVGTTNTSSHDDVALNSLTLRYDNGSGTIPAAGNTLEVSGSAARNCVITSVEGTATSGILVIENYSGTLFPLADNTSITITSSGWTGQVHAPNALYVDGLEPQSYFPKEGFVVDLGVTGAGSNTGLTPSSGANYTTIDERPASTTDYVSDTVDGDYDLYAKGSLPATASAVVAVVPWAYSQKDGALTNMQLPFRIGGTTYVARGATLGVGTEGQQALQVSYTHQQWNHAEHPDDSTGAMSVSDVNSAEVGFRVRT